jgi:signal peptidase I
VISLRRVRAAAGAVALVAVLAPGALTLVPALAGYERYVITGDSMSGAIERGSIVYAKPVPVAQLRVGDVITYMPPHGGSKVTHRIVWTGRGASGARAFRTRGDANASADPWRFELPGPTQARVDAVVPYAGYALAALGVRWVRMLAIGLPAALVAFAVLAGAWRDARGRARLGAL